MPGKMKAANPHGIENIASLTPADENDIRELVSVLDPQAVFDADAVRAALRGGDTRIFVKRHSGRIVATATLVSFATPTGRHNRIEDVVVHPDMRGEGLGRGLMEHLLEFLREEDAVSVELTSRPSREAANRLYRSLGFAQRITNVYEFRFDR